MTQATEIYETIKRTRRYWFVDGLAEMSVGLTFSLLIIYYRAAEGFKPEWLRLPAFVIGAPALILGSTWLLGKAVSALKERITYPRTGYVSYPRRQGSERWKRVILSATIGMAVGAATSLISSSLPPIYQQLFFTALVACVYVSIAYSMGLKRFYLLALGALVLQGLIQLSSLEPDTQYFLFLIGQGALWFLSGMGALIAYLRQNRAPNGEEA